MEFSIKTGQPDKQRTACLVVGVKAPLILSETAILLDKQSQGYLMKGLEKTSFEGKLGQWQLLSQIPNVQADQILFVGCGKKDELKESKYPELLNKIISLLNELGATDTLIAIDDLTVKEKDLAWKIRLGTQIFANSHYKPDALKTQKTLTGSLRKLAWFVIHKKEMHTIEKALQQGIAIAQGIQTTKSLGDLPPNICTPSYLANLAKKFAKRHPKLSVSVLEEKEMAQLGMGLILSVTAGSNLDAKFITFEYRGAKKEAKPIVFVGKGITFDTGGNSMKTGAGMIGMKYDMLGAATVFGVLQAAVELELPLNIIGVVPSCENMPGPSATRPEDIVKSLSGQTVEILNTDAEGRLILADALSYCERYKPEVVIDIATLTGGCLLALGPFASGLMSNYTPLTQALIKAGNACYDRVWELPLWDEYHEALKSDCADFSNVPLVDIGARTIIAGCFLAKFCQKFHWAHLDVANTASISLGPKRGATGRPVSLLVHYLLNECHLL